ncbi:hypothetical protein CH249_01960 [Rhodococcus sp. 05-2255-3B1]|uniref:hypothetical protein n=1 Tax=unclassified Rhodococcus (in: high G+C Gram-positive bacteria) TaxID=192944 RepID=UPI000B9BE8AF|nr:MULTISPECIES: hypothetical protein [unclassified Rhodococcus (in: high G+C Gram-positive bacteria)]OZE13352.1 hypothetical protein CH250_05405 [Rhodococcus sp. 05-2255-3C]OZE16036.1 hypothetical protein CH249_01960 [Rhodococcus sp. 05-2255-3B1]OZE19076.1 hypothetical protein CH255_13985 [Rhodococcus sp. 05-2255-2A2]
MTANEALAEALGWDWQAAVGVPTAHDAVEEVIRDLDELGWVIVSKADADALGEFRAEETRQVRWNAFCELSDLRCLDCNLRYGERKDYPCPPGYPGEGGDHSYVTADVERLTKEAGHDK